MRGALANRRSWRHTGSVLSGDRSDIRDRLHMKTGDRMTFTLMADGTVLLRIKNKSVMSLAGSLRRKGQKPLPVEELSR